MKKTRPIILTVLLNLFGSFVTFYVSNMIFSDVANSFYGFHDVGFLASLSGFLIVPYLIIATLYIIRTYMKPQNRKRITRLYTVLLSVFGLLGVITSVLAGLLYYGSFVLPYPFPGYMLIALVFHTAITAAGIVLRVLCEKLPEDTGRQKISVPYIVYTIVIVILLFLSMNRAGAFLWMPVYVHWETFYMTFPFYISLLLPMGLLANDAWFIFGKFKPTQRTRNMIFLLALTVVIGAVVIAEMSNTTFISVISPALALERLATAPIDTMLHFGLCFIFGVYFLIMSLVRKEIRL